LYVFLWRWCGHLLAPRTLHVFLWRWCWQKPPPALLAFAPSALVLADARAPALLAFASLALVLADARKVFAM